MISRVLLRRTLVLPVLFAALAACSDDEKGVEPGSGTFTLGAPTGTTTIAAGSTVQLSLDVNGSGNFNPVTLTADSVPTGVFVGFAPATIVPGTEQATVSVSVDPSRAAGTFTFRVIARAEGMADQIQRVTVTTTAAPSYTLTSPAQTTNIVIKRGQAGSVTLDLARFGFTGAVDIISDVMPTGVSITPVTGVTGNTTAVIITTTAAAAATTTGTFTLRAINPTIGDRVVTIRYTITPEYTLTNSASTAATAVQIQRTQSGTATININRDTYMGPVTLTASGLPTGITVPTLTDVAGNSATITINTAANAVADTGSFLITATAPGLQNQTTRVRYRVLAEPGIQISSPALLPITQGTPDSLLVTVNREGGYTGPVTVTLSSLPTGVTSTPVTSASGASVYVPLTIDAAAPAITDTITVTVSGVAIAEKTTTTALRIQSRQLTSGVPVLRLGDNRARNSTRLFRIEVPAGATRLRVVMTGGTGDADLNVYNPSAVLAGSSGAAANEESVTIEGAALVAGNWYVQVVLWDPYENVTLTATVTAPATSTAGLRAASSSRVDDAALPVPPIRGKR